MIEENNFDKKNLVIAILLIIIIALVSFMVVRGVANPAEDNEVEEQENVDQDQNENVPNGINDADDEEVDEGTDEPVSNNGYIGTYIGSLWDGSNDGIKPWLTLKENGNFSMEVNGCSVMLGYEGSYAIAGSKLFLTFENPHDGFSGIDGVDSFEFDIVNERELIFRGEDIACGPNKNSKFIKE